MGNSHGVDFDLDCDGMFYCMKIYLQENKNTKHYSLLLFLFLLHCDIHCDGWGKVMEAGRVEKDISVYFSLNISPEFTFSLVLS